MAEVTAMYTADVNWDGKQWLATIPEIPGAHTFARTLNSLRQRLREVVVLRRTCPTVLWTTLMRSTSASDTA